jgi:2-amino-4-hydroxy-6-hydroxymethyldihydropteridine diphosphokinase
MEAIEKEEETGLALGSNIGDRLTNLITAVKKIEKLPSTRIVDIASVYETEPVDVQPEFKGLYFLNTVVIARTEMGLNEMFQNLQSIEREMNGLVRREQNAPRIIDIDIIYFGSVCVDNFRLTVPHPRWYRRRFVVEPLCEVRRELILPGQQKTVYEILSSLPESPKVILYKREWLKEV